MKSTNKNKFKRVSSLQLEFIRIKKNRENATGFIEQSQDINGFDPSKLLDQKYIVKSAGNHLYKCGLSYYKLSNCRKRRVISPKVISLLNLVIILRSILSMSLPDDSGKLFVYLADYTHVLKARYHINPAIIGVAVTQLIAQALHYLEFKQNKRPVYLKPFVMFSGQCCPSDIGLTNEDDIIKMARAFKAGFAVLYYVNITFAVTALIIAIVPLIPHYQWHELLLFGLPWTVVFATYLLLTINMVCWVNLYFYIICQYERARLKQTNLDIKNKLETKIRNYRSIMDLIRGLDSIYREIQEFNDSFWSKYTFILVSLQGFVINLFLYESLYGAMQWFIRIIFFYIALTSASFSLSYLATNSKIAKKAFQGYKSINALYIEYDKWSLPTLTRLKVILCSFK